MRKLITLAVLGMALALFGCAPTGKEAKAPAAPKSLLKCSTCGVEFTDPEGLKQHEKESGHRH